MRKNEIVERIVQIASKHGWAVKNNTKQESWKADVVVSQESYDVAFNISKAPRNVKETYTAMRKDRTCGCWLTLPSKNNFWNHEQEMPVFELEDCNQGDNIDVSLGYEAISLPLDDFIVSIITGHIRYAAEMTVNRLEVEFVENDCWKCGAANHVFFIHSLICKYAKSK